MPKQGLQTQFQQPTQIYDPKPAPNIKEFVRPTNQSLNYSQTF